MVEENLNYDQQMIEYKKYKEEMKKYKNDLKIYEEWITQEQIKQAESFLKKHKK